MLVVGGGPVATSKLEGLRAAGAAITVVAPDVTDEIRAMGVEIRQRPFEEADLDDVWYVVAAATPEVNAHVSRVAGARHLFVNAVDDPPNATAYLGGVVRRGGATIAISTAAGRPRWRACCARRSTMCCRQSSTSGSTQADALKRHWRSTGRADGGAPARTGRGHCAAVLRHARPAAR